MSPPIAPALPGHSALSATHASAGHRHLVGTSFKHEHLSAILQDRLEDGFFEVHAENYMGDGGTPHRMLDAIRREYPLSIHGVGMSIGSPHCLDETHLNRFRQLVLRYEPEFVSEHLAWSSHDGIFYNDLLPLPYTPSTLARVCAHIDQIQDVIRRPILLENPSTYVAFADSSMRETDFIRAIARQTGCGLLLDVNNAYVSATNRGELPSQYIADFPVELVEEIHLAGHSVHGDEHALLLIDSHDCAVGSSVWALYRTVASRKIAVPTLIEWDSKVPDWPTLRSQALHARDITASNPTHPDELRHHGG